MAPSTSSDAILVFVSGRMYANFSLCIEYSMCYIKSNHFYCHITTAQVPWWVKFLWACSRQCRKTTDNLPMDRQCKKTINNLHMDRQCKKLHWSIYSAPDSAKKKKKKHNNSNLHMDRQCKKKHQFTYGQYIFTDCTEDNVQNTHTYTQYT